LALTELLASKKKTPKKHFNHIQHQFLSCFQACFCIFTLHKHISQTQGIIYAPANFTAKVRNASNTALFRHASLGSAHLLGFEPPAWQAHECLVSTRKIKIARF
jgi:hypothetical protein